MADNFVSICLFFAWDEPVTCPHIPLCWDCSYTVCFWDVTVKSAAAVRCTVERWMPGQCQVAAFLSAIRRLKREKKTQKVKHWVSFIFTLLFHLCHWFDSKVKFVCEEIVCWFCIWIVSITHRISRKSMLIMFPGLITRLSLNLDFIQNLEMH